MGSMSSDDVSRILPRVLIVSRRTVRKNKFVDFVGEYHLDLIVKYGAVPIMVPRVSGIHTLISSFEPIHGVLLCEGEDIDPSHYDNESTLLTQSELDEIQAAHASDTAIDSEKDSIELGLARLCLERNIPYLGICRGSQVLNVASGGTLYQDVEKELQNQQNSKETVPNRVVHMNYANYDGHRHAIRVVKDTPLEEWFKDSLQLDAQGENKQMMMVNSYHHQGVKKLATRFVPMAYAEDGLIEGFYDPVDGYNPDQGKFIMGIQFHPERMRKDGNDDEFDYPGCPTVYKQFVKAVIAYQKKLGANYVHTGITNANMEKKKRKLMVRSFSLAKDLYKTHTAAAAVVVSHHHRLRPAGAHFLQEETTNSAAALSLQQEQRLKQIGATVRNGFAYHHSLKMNQERKEKVARSIIEKMSTEQLSDMISFYYMMAHICSEVFNTKVKRHTS